MSTPTGCIDLHTSEYADVTKTGERMQRKTCRKLKKANLVWNYFTCRKNMKRHKKCVPLFRPSFYFSLDSQELWFIHRWHHGDHSYFYWLVNGQLFSMLCHLSNPHQSTSPREKKKKKSTTQKWLRVERRNTIHACHATVQGMFHESDVLSQLLVCYPYLPVLFIHRVYSAQCVLIKTHTVAAYSCVTHVFLF